MDPTEVPPCGPGQLTTVPTDIELYHRGYIEVPKTGNGNGNCPGGNCGPGGAYPGFGPMYDNLPPVQNQPASPPAPASGARRTPTGQKSAAFPTNARRGGATGTGATAQTVSSTRLTGSPQRAYGPQPATSQRSSDLQPAIIGPLGYDELK
jgi:hypothetical protein